MTPLIYKTQPKALYKNEIAKKNVGKYIKLVKISITNPFTDQFILRSFKYSAINATKTKKETIPSKIVIGYSTGCLDTSPNETIESHIRAQASPNAPIADNPMDIAEVLMLQ